MKPNKNFKNSVFTALFSDPDLLRELYCAIGGVSLPPDVPVSINTLENVLYMDLYNDISFEIGGKLVVLIEHQSTINPNMALRLFLYIARVLEKKVKGKTLYSKKQIKIPRPEFFVLYNGTGPFPDNAVLRLSDLFEKPESPGFPEKARPLLELEVKVININEGRNTETVNRCKNLSEYSFFIGKVRACLEGTGDLEEAIKKAEIYCQKNGILDWFLETHGSEVLNMILTEWNTEDAIAFAREEGREEGWEKGIEKGIVKGKMEIARSLLNVGDSVDKIITVTGLTRREIESLR